MLPGIVIPFFALLAFFGLLACGIVILIFGVTAQELGRLFLRRKVGRWESGLAGVVGALLALTLAVLSFKVLWPAR